MNIREIEQSILRPQLIEGIIFKRLPSFIDWVICIASGYGVGTVLHLLLS